MSEIDCLRIEIRRNWRGKLDYREGDLNGSVEMSNTTAKDILQEIECRMIDLEKEDKDKKKLEPKGA